MPPRRGKDSFPGGLEALLQRTKPLVVTTADIGADKDADISADVAADTIAAADADTASAAVADTLSAVDVDTDADVSKTVSIPGHLLQRMPKKPRYEETHSRITVWMDKSLLAKFDQLCQEANFTRAEGVSRAVTLLVQLMGGE